MLQVRWRETGAAGLLSFVVKGMGYCIAAAALTLVLYAPVLTVSGVDAVFFNNYIPDEWRGDGWHFFAVLVNAARGYVWWHMATPIWAQAVLFLTLLIGAAAPRLPTGQRGVLAIAAFFGGAALLAVMPVALRERDMISCC